MKVEAALDIAFEKNLDLVKIAPNSVPPVCKIMDYGKFRFEQSKRDKETKKNQKVIEVKEIRMSPGIGINDFNTKLRNGQKFLIDGDRLKVTVRFRGREMTHTDIGMDLLKRFAEQCAVYSDCKQAAKLEGRFMTMFLSSKTPSKFNFGRRTTMPKLKSHSGAKKRFSLTSSGKVKRAHANRRHILTKKNTKRKRGLRQGAYADVTNESAIKRMIPYK
jgi:translation initiation factor IF-3